MMFLFSINEYVNNFRVFSATVGLALGHEPRPFRMGLQAQVHPLDDGHRPIHRYNMHLDASWH